MPNPIRIQRQRTKGWRAPEGVVYVGRPSKWGNAYTIGAPDIEAGGISAPAGMVGTITREIAVDRFAAALASGRLRFSEADVRRELRGKRLMCFCRLDQRCHADVLLECANA